MFGFVRAGSPSLALGLLAGLYVFWLTATPGPGLEPDSMSYVGAAESLVRHGTLRVPWTYWPEADSTSPLSDFPPAFSVAIAVPLAAGAPRVQAARWVMVLGLAVAIGVFAALAADAAGAAAAALLTGLVLATPAVVGVNTIVMSEPLFLAVLALTLRQMVAVPERAWRYGMLAGIGALVRYAGVALIAAAGLWAFAQPGDRRARLRRAAAAGLPGIALQALWVVRTDLEGGDTPHTSFDFYGGLWRTVRGGLGVVCGWLVPTVPAGAARDGVALVIAVLLLALCRSAVRSRDAAASGSRRLLAALGLVAVCYVGVVVYARLSLGRNIGFVPAQRNVVRSGAYRHVRHPIYTGLFLVWASLMLRFFSPANVGILLTIYALYVIKSIVEESFLRQDPEYAQYMDQVKYRFIPGLV